MISWRRIALLVGLTALPLLLWGSLPMSSTGAGSASIQQKIQSKRQAVQQKKGREQVLNGSIRKISRKINLLQGSISQLQTKQFRVETQLAKNQAELSSLQSRLRREQVRLQRLKARLFEGEQMLAVRLVELYKADSPDIVTVILESDGFADMLERTEFMHRVSHQDQRIIRSVQSARVDAKATAKRLGKMEARQKKVTASIAQRRNTVVQIKQALEARRGEFSRVREKKSATLSNVREDRHHMEGDLKILEKEQAKIEAKLRAAAQNAPGGGMPLPVGPIVPGSGQLIWPVGGPGNVVSPFGQRWGRLHAGIDIALPAGTPIRAADTGTVILMGPTSGYGNYTCVAHGGGLSTCYAHQSRYATSVGAKVMKGQVIGYVGCTGHCFGDHLHFETRINGVPVNPMNYL